MLYFDPMYFLFISPALILSFVAQAWLSRAYASAGQIPARYTGAQTARLILDAAGLGSMPIQMTPGHLSDHYDPGSRTVNLSTEVYRGNSLAAMGIAAHEVGHAIQHASRYPLFGLRSLAVPLANFGGGAGMMALMVGIFLQLPTIAWVGIGLFSLVALFQIINLPVEFDASGRAKRILAQMGLLHPDEMGPVRSVLYAAALTYVAGTLQSVLQVAYYAFILLGSGDRRSNDD